VSVQTAPALRVPLDASGDGRCRPPRPHGQQEGLIGAEKRRIDRNRWAVIAFSPVLAKRDHSSLPLRDRVEFHRGSRPSAR